MGEGNCGAFDGTFDGLVDAAVSSGLEERPLEEQATLSGDSVKGRRTKTSSGARHSLDAVVAGMSDAAVTGIDDDIGAKVGVCGGDE